MCGIACYFGTKGTESELFIPKALNLLKHRGPDDNGYYSDDYVSLVHTRLSIIDLSKSGHQPMVSSCERYVMVFNGEIYNHNDLRKKYLSAHPFRGHSDSETILELFRLRKEKMLEEMVGMWALIIWDKVEKKIFISRDRYGQKPLYVRRHNNKWIFSSEIKPLVGGEPKLEFLTTAVVEYLVLGNYGHLGNHTFFKDIQHFESGTFSWLGVEDKELKSQYYWKIPFVEEKDKVPFDKKIERELHDKIVDAVLSQTLSDVPIGITLSGGIDSSIIAGILGTHYNQKVDVFTAQAVDNKYDETKYVNAVLEKYGANKFNIHRLNLNNSSIMSELDKYINIQEEPFGDPSIIAHGLLMKSASEVGIKVILNGQGADELFLGYNNLTQAILIKQLFSFDFSDFNENIKKMKLSKIFLYRTLLMTIFPKLENYLRNKSRVSRREIIKNEIKKNIDETLVKLYRYDNVYDVWNESIYGVHLPHLIHYDDRNAMAYGIEGRMPFLDHRIIDFISKIQTKYFLRHGYRKFILREACKEYLPEIIYKRTDKIGFYTPLIDIIYKNKIEIVDILKENQFFDDTATKKIIDCILSNTVKLQDALYIWRYVSVMKCKNIFNI